MRAFEAFTLLQNTVMTTLLTIELSTMPFCKTVLSDFAVVKS